MSNLTCKDGILIPALAVSPRNAVFYLAALFYTFLGIAIAADIFMCSIEQITSATKKVKKSKKKDQLVDENSPENDDDYEEVQVWNPTIANLSLMALGSSAPEILLSVIEIVGNGFRAGELGPGTIVGSAAFNLFCISAICVLAISSPNTKRIESFKVFLVTAFSAIFAYIWLLVILTVTSPNIVEIWEAGLTLFFFVCLIVIAYLVDIQIWKGKTADLGEELEMVEKMQPGDQLTTDLKRYASQASVTSGGERRVGPIPTPPISTVKKLTRDIARTYPALPAKDQARILAYRLNQNTKHDRLYYRIRAIREWTSAWHKTEDEREVERAIHQAEIEQTDGRAKPQIEFSARVYSVGPNDKHVILTIVRRGPCQSTVSINYQTVNGVAKRDLHFLAKSETIQFGPGERKRDVQVQLVEGAEWRPNHVFYVHVKIQDQPEGDRTKLGPCSVARVRFPDQAPSMTSEPCFEFVRSNYVVAENCGWVRLFVTKRGKLNREKCSIELETHDLTAQSNFDYMPIKNGKIVFEGQEYEKYIDVEILDDKQDEKDETFLVELTGVSLPELSLGQKRKTTVTIISDDSMLRNITNIHKLMGHYMRQMTPGQATWKEQIMNATSVNAGDVANATLGDCLLHALAFPWKFALAFIPPPSILGGWLCFLVALAVIGLITAVVGDLASIFGCMVGMKDAVTAITLVALGTSLPDTFASKIAAQNDDSADNAVGNVTGSNSVNVFLGLGLPWLVAALYWANRGENFEVQAGDLGFSVTVFTVCSILFLLVLVLRRTQALFGKAELGGPAIPKIASGLFFVLLWLTYVTLSIWNTYN